MVFPQFLFVRHSDLNSCVAAELIEKSQNKTVHLEFTSSFEGKYLKCDVKNLGTDPVLFRLPALGKGEFLKNIQEVKSNWPTSETDKSLYRVENGRTYSLAAMTVIETFTTDEVEVAVAMASALQGYVVSSSSDERDARRADGNNCSKAGPWLVSIAKEWSRSRWLGSCDA